MSLKLRIRPKNLDPGLPYLRDDRNMRDIGYLSYRDLFILVSGMYIWLVHIVGGDRREEVGADILWSDIVGIGIWLIRLPDIVLSGEYTIYARLNMCPSVPVSIFAICISSARALRFEYSLYRSPATRYIILECEIVLGCIGLFRGDSDTDSIEFSSRKNPSRYRCCRDELTPLIESF